MIGDCPPAGELQRLLANELSDAQEQALEAHIADCAACRQRLDELTGFALNAHTPRPSQNGNHEASSGRGGALVRLVHSASAGQRPIEEGAANDKLQPKSSSGRSLGSSSILASGRFLRRQVWTWPLIAAVLLGGAGWWVSRSIESAMRQQRINELTTLQQADLVALRGWMEQQRSAVQVLAADEQLGALVQELLVLADETPEARSQLVQAQAQPAIRSLVAEPLQRGGHHGFVIVSPSGIALADNDDAPIGVTLAGYSRKFFAEVVAKEAAVSKPFLNPLLQADSHGEMRANQPCMCAAAPIKDHDGRTIAVLGLRIRPEDQFTKILHAARSGKTGETYAFDRSGVLLSESRFDDQLKQVGLLVDRPESKSILNLEVRDPGVNMVAGRRPATRRTDQPLTRMASAAVQGGQGYDVDGYRDYRGVPVVGAWQWLDEYDFGVTTEIDAAEAFGPAYILRRAFAMLMGLLVAAAVGIYLAMLYIARQNQELQNAALAAEQFGQYTLGEKLGTGGMGTVYKARHALLRRPTAVKLLNPEIVSSTSIARFEREVQLTSGLSHPNTVAIYDYGRTPGGVFYYAMEYLEGINLDELVKQYGPLPEARAMYVLRQVAASLAEAHAAGLIHRDIKPANIVLTVRGGQHDFVKVLDFGLAKLAGDLEKCLTSADMVAGTPLYVSPEAITHPQGIDVRADVYAIGAVAYFLLTGSPVFVGSSSADICLMHVNATPVPPSARTLQPITPQLEALLLRCLAKAPADRPDNAAELLSLLEMCPVSGRWTSADADRWWKNRAHEHSAVTELSPALAPPATAVAVNSGDSVRE